MQLTERILNDAAGWQVMKQARVLHEMGRAIGAVWEPPLLQGRVREGEREFRCGLRILSRTAIENFCSCRDSRQRGIICAHSVAVGLEALKPHAPVASAPAAPAGSTLPQATTRPPEISADDGESIELAIVLPANFAAAWEKGTITLGCEAISGGRRVLLTALEKSRRYRCSEPELSLVAELRRHADGELPGILTINRESMLRLLPLLAGHPRVTLGRAVAVEIRSEALRPPLQIDPAPDHSIRLRVELPPNGTLLLAGAGQPWHLSGPVFRPIAPGLAAAYHPLLAQEIVLSPEQASAFFQQEISALHASFVFDPSDAALGVFSASEQPLPEFTLRLEGSLSYLEARLSARYGEHEVTLTSPPSGTRYLRNPAVEAGKCAQLRHAGFTGPDAGGRWVLKGESSIVLFFARDLPIWESSSKVVVGARFQHVSAGIERLEPRLEIQRTGEDWFEMQVELATPGGDRVSSAEIKRLLQGGKTHFRRADGKMIAFNPDQLQEFETVLRDCDPKQRQPGLYQVDRRHAAYIGRTAEELGTTVVAPSQWRAWANASRELLELRPVPLGSLESVLRPYQKEGVYWMNFLAQNGFCGILADEMGLGKTLQTLAFLKAVGGRSLVVCPSSLVFNWKREAERFTPELQVIAVEGSDRRKHFDIQFQGAHLVLTSYPLLRRDLEQYRGIDFNVVVLDEAQHIKNPASQNATAASAIRSRHRLALTGTPLENSLSDIWSLMHFLMPGYLGTRQDFSDRYLRPITSDPKSAEQQRLLRRISPFVLRRDKKTVATELPEKIEQVAFCELTDAQKTVYSALANEAKAQLSTLAKAKNAGQAKLRALTALLRLRQTCCDLRLLGSPHAEAENPSAKLNLLQELLGEAIDGGHRVLVFSQFVEMLRLIAGDLEAGGIDYCYLDGATKQRETEVDRFQNGAAPVFLISLKAGGTGLNLTAADTVIHFDPWWNPAVEAQATDRAHRIGQKRVVTSYKLITRGTVEEKIAKLQTSKRRLFDELITPSSAAQAGNLTFGEIEALLND
jgi:superfamily II DNA or RNA helicase